MSRTMKSTTRRRAWRRCCRGWGWERRAMACPSPCTRRRAGSAIAARGDAKGRNALRHPCAYLVIRVAPVPNVAFDQRKLASRRGLLNKQVFTTIVKGWPPRSEVALLGGLLAGLPRQDQEARQVLAGVCVYAKWLFIIAPTRPHMCSMGMTRRRVRSRSEHSRMVSASASRPGIPYRLTEVIPPSDECMCTWHRPSSRMPNGFSRSK